MTIKSAQVLRAILEVNRAKVAGNPFGSLKQLFRKPVNPMTGVPGGMNMPVKPSLGSKVTKAVMDNPVKSLAGATALGAGATALGAAQRNSGGAPQAPGAPAEGGLLDKAGKQISAGAGAALDYAKENPLMVGGGLLGAGVLAHILLGRKSRDEEEV